MAITITLPENEAEIPAIIATLTQEAKAAKARLDAIYAQIKAVRSMCTHPENKVTRSRDRGGCSEGRCSHCGYSW